MVAEEENDEKNGRLLCIVRVYLLDYPFDARFLRTLGGDVGDHSTCSRNPLSTIKLNDKDDLRRISEDFIRVALFDNHLTFGLFLTV